MHTGGRVLICKNRGPYYFDAHSSVATKFYKNAFTKSVCSVHANGSSANGIRIRRKKATVFFTVCIANGKKNGTMQTVEDKKWP